MSGGRDWTTGDARRLQEMRAQRVPMKVIAFELGRTEAALQSFLRYIPCSPGKPRGYKPLGYRINAWPTEEVDRLRQFASEGATSKEIGELLGRPAEQVRSKASREGIRFSPIKRSPIYLEREGLRLKRDAVKGSAMLREALFEMVK